MVSLFLYTKHVVIVLIALCSALCLKGSSSETNFALENGAATDASAVCVVKSRSTSPRAIGV